MGRNVKVSMRNRRRMCSLLIYLVNIDPGPLLDFLKYMPCEVLAYVKLDST